LIWKRIYTSARQQLNKLDKSICQFGVGANNIL
jgi:hypothetical protein